ncbi:GrpB family protein [Roseibium aggregatum]|uniref:GrpB family protein n=1 Tax=Roseibium aggregatum TaxID=187304 RepID=A0A939J623_9HYPH|nr:GrpB family protein [Roseibium aggregatum]MBN9672840.1 GrpB family protein [Roseibium aggregatum]
MQPHNPNWIQQANLLIEDLKSMLAENIERAEHVGSTAVPGLSAKPKLHIDIELADAAVLQDLRAELCGTGYADLGFLHHSGEVQMTRPAGERFRFQQESGETRLMAHRICLAPTGFHTMAQRRAFRDMLLQSNDLARTYGTLKARLAEEAGDPPDWNHYNGGKTSFFESVIASG